VQSFIVKNVEKQKYSSALGQYSKNICKEAI